MKNKRKIIIILFLFGIGLIIFGLFSYHQNTSLNKNRNGSSHEETYYDIEEDSLVKDKKYTPITNFSNKNQSLEELNILNFTCVQNEENMILNFDLENLLDKDISNEILKINFYQEDKLLDTFEYEIEELKSHDMISVNINYSGENIEDINQYEFEIFGFKTKVNSN